MTKIGYVIPFVDAGHCLSEFISGDQGNRYVNSLCDPPNTAPNFVTELHPYYNIRYTTTLDLVYFRPRTEYVCEQCAECIRGPIP